MGKNWLRNDNGKLVKYWTLGGDTYKINEWIYAYWVDKG